MMSRTRAFASNAGATAAYQLALIVASFIIPRFIIQFYGSEVNGLIASLTQFVAYFTVVEAGISGAAVFALYRPLAEKDWTEISRLVSAARRFYIQAGTIFVALVALLAVVYPLLADVSGLESWQIALLAAALGVGGALDFFTLGKYRALLTADKRMWVIQLASTVYVVLNTATIAVLAAFQIDLVIIYVLAILPMIVRTLIMMVYARRSYPRVDYHAPNKGVALHQRWDALFLQVQNAVQQGAPIIIATIMLRDLVLVSVFSIYLLVALGCQRVANIVGTGLQAIFGEVLVKERVETLQRAFREYEVVVHSLTAIICGVALGLINPFIQLYVGGVAAENYVYPMLGWLIVINVYFYQIKTPQGLMVISAGLFRETRWRTAIQTGILIVCSVVLSGWFGFYGIMFGLLLSNIYRTIDLYLFASTHVTKIAPISSLWRSLVTAFQIALTSLPVFILDLSFTNWGEWITVAVCVTLWSLIVVSVSDLLTARTETLSLFRSARRLLLGARGLPRGRADAER